MPHVYVDSILELTNPNLSLIKHGVTLVLQVLLEAKVQVILTK